MRTGADRQSVFANSSESHIRMHAHPHREKRSYALTGQTRVSAQNVASKNLDLGDFHAGWIGSQLGINRVCPSAKIRENATDNTLDSSTQTYESIRDRVSLDIRIQFRVEDQLG